MSSKRKVTSPRTSSNKQPNDSPDNPRKRLKLSVKDPEDENRARTKKNFIRACQLVSHRDFFDHRSRFLLVCLPSCMTLVGQDRDNNSSKIKQMPSYVDETFKTETQNSVWYEALDVCNMRITPTEYLSSKMLTEVVEIMLNIQEDKFSEFTTKYIIDKSQKILMLHFNTHPPCSVQSLRDCYKNFLTSPMAIKENTFSNRAEFECSKGIVKYCMNRLEHELSSDSEDGPLFDKQKYIPEDMRDSLRGIYWQKQHFEILELLSRQERIKRLFAVLESIIELLQFDVAIWHSRHSSNLVRNIMRSHKPLMAYVLWSENVLFTGAVTNNCRQIIRIFAQLIHLQYPDSMVKIFTMWLNTMVQSFYICEKNSNMDYPNTSKYCNTFAKEFYTIISDFPHQSIIRILERIQPTYMRHLVGMLHIQEILSVSYCCILQILIEFIRDEQWKLYSSDNSEIVFLDKMFCKPIKVENKLEYALKIIETPPTENNIKSPFPKMKPKIGKIKIKVGLNHVIHSLYVVLDAYFEAYDIQSVQETWNKLNEQQTVDSESDSVSSSQINYTVTETLIKKYRDILKSKKELKELFSDLKKHGKLPEMIKVFENMKSIVC